ncbi:hypothetical protein TNCV_2369241 [Trichonephila clavipes]|nr:hypothetical protein TNCV_2369241 [Trichonephila clavipes]
MAPHTITPAVGVVCLCKSSFLVRSTTPNGSVGGIKRNGHRNHKRRSARHLCMVREDTGAPNKGATCAWMAVDEAVDLVTSHVNVCRNEITDGLAGAGSNKDSTHDGGLTFSNIATQVKEDINSSWRQSPIHE